MEQPVSCEKMNRDEDDHARRSVECRQTGTLAPLKRVIGVRDTQSETPLVSGPAANEVDATLK